jgi:hypothetical protein
VITATPGAGLVAEPVMRIAAAPVVRRIFAEFTSGHGFYAIAEGLTRDGIPSPSAHDPARNWHRCGIALGHTTKLRWNETGTWIWSEKIVHPPIIDRETFDQVQVMVSGRRTNHTQHKTAPQAASLRAAWPGLLRPVRAADAKPLGPRRALLPVPVSLRIRAGQPRRAPAET